MATEYLNAGAVSFAAANWNDGAGGSGSGLANGNDYICSEDFALVDDALDHSGLTGVESFKITESAHSGQIGSSGESLNIDVDASADAVLSNRGNTTLYWGVSGRTANNVDIGGASQTWLTGGTAAMITQDGGVLNVSGAATVTNMDQYGGSSIIKHGGGGAITEFNFDGGTSLLERQVTTINAAGNGTLTLDLNDAAGAVALNTRGLVRVVVINANITSGTGFNGILDFSRARKPLTPVMAIGGARVISSANLIESSLTRRGNSQKAYSVSLT